jgi:rubredoxin
MWQGHSFDPASLPGGAGIPRFQAHRSWTNHPSNVSPTLSGMTTETTTARWICESCGFIYDPDDGDPDGGIPPGTAFDDIPDTWFCPVCGARKKDFTRYTD